MNPADIVASLKGLPRAVAIEVVYLVGHQLAHPDLSVIDAQIPTAALSVEEAALARATAHKVIEMAESALGRSMKAFTKHQAGSINEALRAYMRNRIINPSAAAKREASEFLGSLAA
ncbi:hypothetical protein [Sphingomonas sp. SUN039]|uniref:hypothetical protein n=1 Tax=Sphingomonas sp. SUN039 TaxID=2937787 RepID=UPI0021648105|nr:hypothetical protein [Sphingomonas sp. SUN039]UVO53378.1 hypothetical protein M0209_04300 [Sphingomonas sp. SUN039]